MVLFSEKQYRCSQCLYCMEKLLPFTDWHMLHATLFFVLVVSEPSFSLKKEKKINLKVFNSPSLQGTSWKLTTLHRLLCRYLLLVLMEAERAWSYAMQLKQEANTEPRKRFHLLARLRKAAKHSENLEKLCESPNVDAKTKLEAQVSLRTGCMAWSAKYFSPLLNMWDWITTCIQVAHYYSTRVQ